MKEHYLELLFIKHYWMLVMTMNLILKKLNKLEKKLFGGLVKVLVSLPHGLLMYVILPVLMINRFARLLVNLLTILITQSSKEKD